MKKMTFIFFITNIIYTNLFGTMVVHDPITSKILSANLPKQIADMAKQYQLLTDTLQVNKGIMFETSANTQRQIVSDAIRKQLPGELGNTIAQMSDGCLQDFGLDLGLGFKLPKLSICGVDLVGKISNQIEKELAKNNNDTTLTSTRVPSINNKNKPTEKEVKEALKSVGALANGSSSGKKNVSEGTGDGSENGDGPVDNREAIIDTPSGKLSTLKDNTKKQPSIFDGTPYTPSQKEFASKLYNQKATNDILKKVDRKKQANNQKAVTDMLNEDLKTQVEEHPDNNALTNVPVIIPQIKESSSYVRTDDGDHVLLASGNYDKHLFVTQYSLNTGDQFIKEGMEPLKKFEKNYKKWTGNIIEISKGEQLNYARMAELNFRSTLLAVNSMNMSSDKGAQLIQAEYLKGILAQLYILNTQLTVMYDKQARNDTMRYRKIEDRLDNFSVLLEQMLQQNREYNKVLINK